MSTAEKIQATIKNLPTELQAEVLHFAEQLLARAQQNGNDHARGQAMAEILTRIAANPEPFTDEDPVEWQRAQRQDRSLPSR